ncbi:MAG TPA: LUD domain-containing protein, partial [bacterium]|nr:LUD domain-containing protein [bacterium]
MDANREWYKESLLERVSENLKKRGFNAFWSRNRDEAKAKILELIPEGSRVGIGGSISIRELGIIDDLEARGYTIVHHWKSE